ncbi:hypothetical protein VP5_046 [Vibrio virus VPMCC5]|nr:hypothetical protein VP5_046 [Vibrio virus VPMCC5]
MSKKEQSMCCGTTCDKGKVSKYIDKLQRERKEAQESSVEAMFEHFSDMMEKTKCKTLTIKSIKEWAGIKED